jgi:hypothetical protein
MFLREKSNHELALRIFKYLKNRQTEEMQAKSFVYPLELTICGNIENSFSFIDRLLRCLITQIEE